MKTPRLYFFTLFGLTAFGLSPVLQPPGTALSAQSERIQVTDSIAPGDDLQLPFGETSVGVRKSGTVRITNTHPEENLVLERIRLVPEDLDEDEPERQAVESGAETQYFSTTESDTASRTPEPVSSPGMEKPDPRLPAPPPDWDREHDPGTILVRFRPGAALERAAAHAVLGGRTTRAMRRVPIEVVTLPQGASPRAMVEAYRKHPAVEYAEPNYILQLENQPDDPLFSDLWGLHNTGQQGGLPGADISAPEAWTWTQGSREIVVGVVDTGINYEHPDLAANMWVNPDPDPLLNDIHGATWIDGDGNVTSGDPMDDNGHGTHVAGTIGAVGDNGIGVVGVNWNVRLMALKFFDSDGFGTTADAVAAIEYAIENGAHLTNNSWGGTGFSQSLRDMIAEARDANQLFVTAAGNNDSNNDLFPRYPASFDLDNIISVAASNRHDERAFFSNYGAETVHLAAPGHQILSTELGETYATYSGTSMAAPHVAGVAALLLSLNPDAEYRTLKNAILDGVTPLPHWENRVVSGGRLDAAGALHRIVRDFQLSGIPGTMPVTLTPGRSLVLEIAYEPVEPGEHESRLVIESNDPVRPRIDVVATGVGVTDALEIDGDGPLVSEGYAGGPFVPDSQTYSLHNNGEEPIEWTASATVSWITIDTTSGTLGGGAGTTVGAHLNAEAETLPAGEYPGSIRFTNTASGLTREQNVHLNILPLPGRLDVTDSIPPDDDLNVPFGQVLPGEEAAAFVTLTNTHENHALIVEDISLLGGFRNDFERPYLEGWEERPAASWNLENNRYGTRVPERPTFAQSTYAEELWFDRTVETEVRIEGNPNTTAVLLLRASHDFDIDREEGNAILIGFNGDGYYYIGRMLDGRFSFIQNWTLSEALNVAPESNVMLASIKDNGLHVFANENLLWSGQAEGIFQPGRIGLAAYIDPDAPATYEFDYIDVREALDVETLPLTVEQSWLNARADNNLGTHAMLRSASASTESPPEKQRAGDPEINHVELLNRWETFSLPDLSSLPFEISPGESRDVAIHFTPSGESDFERTLRIRSNDPDKPEADVLLSGTSVKDPLRLFPTGGFKAQGETGGPFHPSEIVYTLFNNSTEEISWQIQDHPSWLRVQPGSGTLSDAAIAELQLSFNRAAHTRAPGIYSGTVEIVNSQTGHTRTIPVELEVRIPLCEALQACDLVWETGGDAQWRTQDEVTFRSETAAQSGAIGDNRESWIETHVSGPGELSFWWWVSSEANFDFLDFHINDEFQTEISGEKGWEQQTFKLAEGEHTLRWRYIKDFIFSEGLDAGWLDEVSWTPTEPERHLVTDDEVAFGLLAIPQRNSIQPLQGMNERSLRIRNTGDSTLSIDSISFPSAFSGDWQNAQIAPGEFRDLMLSFNPSGPGEYVGTLEFHSNATNGIQKVGLSGYAVHIEEAFKLENGQVFPGLAGIEGNVLHFVLNIPGGQKRMTATLSGGSGDADLYVRHGELASLENWDYAPREVGNNETVIVDRPAEGARYFMVYGYDDFADAAIAAKFEPMQFDAWTRFIDLPPDSRNLLDRHGPLQTTTLEAYAFGRDPRTLTSGDLPRIERSPDNPGRIDVVYRVHAAADDIAIGLETSTDLDEWDPVSPLSETILSESDGIQVRRAVIDTQDRTAFFIRTRVIHEDAETP